MAVKPFLLCILAGFLVGCQFTPDEQLVGAWSADRAQCQIPDFGDNQRQFENAIYATQLKLSSDHTFILTGLRQIGGKWSYKNGTLNLKPSADSHLWQSRILAAMRKLTVSPDFGEMKITIETQIGDILVVLDKTA